jgi:hypothetical protein
MDKREGMWLFVKSVKQRKVNMKTKIKNEHQNQNIEKMKDER